MTFNYSFRQHDKNLFIFVDEVLVLVLVDEKNTVPDHNGTVSLNGRIDMG